MTATTHLLSRRRLLQGAAAGAGTVALASCGPDERKSAGVFAARVGRVPVDDPDDGRWESAPETNVELGPQNLVTPQKLVPALTALKVRALHDDDVVAFRLEWNDPDADDLTVRVDDFRDACAVLLAPGAAVEAMRTMGSVDTPATLLHWKADWQRDVDQGRQGLEAVYPNRTADAYPPLWNVSPADVGIAAYQEAGATEWLPGVHVDNPISLGGRISPVEKAIAHGFSTTATAPTQDARGRGVRTATGWRVVLSKSLSATDEGETEVRSFTTLTCAFAVWSGSAHDAGSRKSPSTTVHALDMAP